MTRRLSIVSVCRSLPTQDDPSAGIFVRNRLEAMAAIADLRVVQPLPHFPIIAPLAGWAREKSRRSGGLEVTHAPMFYVPGVAKSLDARWLARSITNTLMRLHREQPIDLIDAHFGYPDGAGCLPVARRLGIPLFITLRGFEKEFIARPRVGPQMLTALHAAKGLIAVSHSLRRFAIENGIAPGHVRVVHNAIDARLFSFGDQGVARLALGIPPDADLVVSVGHLIPRKRHNVLIEAFARLLRERPRAQLAIIGSPAPDAVHAARLRARTASLGLQERVRFLGNVPPAVVVDWLRAASVFALATEREGCCNAVLEALATGAPVITTPVGDNAEFVADGQNGYLFPVDDVGSLERALLVALARTDWRRQGISSRLHQQVGGWPDVAAQVIEFMRASTGQ